MNFMQLAPMQKNNSQQQLMQMLMQTALSRGGTGAPAAPAQGATMPGGAMNLVPPAGGGFMDMLKRPGQMGLLSKLFGAGGTFGGMSAGTMQPGSQDALY